MKKSALFLAAFLASSVAWGRSAMTQGPLNVRTVDGTVSNYPYQLKVSNGGLTDNANGTMTFSAIISTTVSQAQTINITSGTITTFNASTATITNLVGTTTNDNAAVGNYGQYISSSILSGAENTPPGTATYFDVASIPLTAGDWDVSAIIAWTGGTTVQRVTGGVGTATGNNAAGLSFGNTWVQGLGPTAASDVNFAVPAVRQSLSGSATIYLKGYAEYTVGTPKAYGRISARRVR